MADVDVSVTRSLTINTGNYESIRPTVTLTARGVAPENVDDAYLALEEAITGLLKMEILNCHSEARKVGDGLDPVLMPEEIPCSSYNTTTIV